MCDLQTSNGESVFDDIDLGFKSILDESFHPFFGNIDDKCMDNSSIREEIIVEESEEMGKALQMGIVRKKSQSLANAPKRSNRKSSGKACGVPRDGNVDKKEESELLWTNVVESQSAFLGPNLWDNKTIPYDNDLKYCDLDEFLSENGLPVEGDQQNGTSAGNVNPGTVVAASHQGGGGGALMPGVNGRLSPPPPAAIHPIQHLQTNGTGGVGAILTKREPSPSPSEPLSPITINPPSPADSTLSFASSSRDFDPRTRPFSDEELKPQPMFVPDGLKDEKYWARRRKNNMAAKRSRDARRMKENQIALRAGFLEKENMGLRQEMERLKKENLALRDRLSKFTNEI
ncbi:hepatic leukemia factor isoform X2 [Sipha flava]|uniref:Hepatic leukemia factor isoform X2 n=1 Tax=Sipha flava TaxID=143950 RepID=A0A8B8GNC9_9HEMI|nr:hepatic leukemia factor isoform X2 [Sipha flava]